jgi:uncharacterized membrane protein
VTNRVLRWFFIITAAPDAVIGLLMVVCTDAFARFLHVSPPEHPLFVWVSGLMIMFVSIGYLIAASDPPRYCAYIALAGAVRWGTAVLLWCAMGRGLIRHPFTALVPAEIIVGAIYLFYAVRIRRDTSNA